VVLAIPTLVDADGPDIMGWEA
ncbi:hypothetical protein A2U01_0066936, partial [Trifolium medium]|nr:hypothetical protein [Trifolium medium]